MTSMAVSMNLTLTDAASGPLRAFIAQLEGLQAVTGKIAPKLEAIATAIGSVGKAAESSAAVKAFGDAVAGMSGQIQTAAIASKDAATGMGQFSKATQAASLASFALEQAAAAVGGTLGRITAQIQAAGAAMQGAAAHMATMAGAATAMGAATTGMNQLGAATATTATHASNLWTALKGITELWAAMKIDEGLKASFGAAKDFENTKTRMVTGGVSADDRAALLQRVGEVSKAVPQFNQNELLELAIDLRQGFGSVEEASKHLEEVAKAAYNMKAADPTGFNMTDLLSGVKYLEQRKATMGTEEKWEAELDILQKIYASTQGRVDAQKLLGNIQYAKGGLGQTLDTDFMPFFAAIIEQIRSGGGNGGMAGTWLTSLYQDIEGKGNESAQKERARLGLAKVAWNDNGNVDQKRSNLTMAGAQLFAEHPDEWVMKVLKPALERAGVDMSNDTAINEELGKLFSDRNAANMASMILTRHDLLQKDAGLIAGAQGGKDQYAANSERTQSKLDTFHAQLENLEIILGDRILPVINKVMSAFGDGLQVVSDWFAAHPIAAEIAVWAAAIGSVVLAVAGFVAILGAGVAGVTTFAGALGITGAGLATLATTVGGVIAKVSSLAAAFTIGFAFGEWLNSFDIFGQSLSDWLSDLMIWVVEAFKSAWHTVGDIIMSVIPGAQAAEAVGRAGPPVAAAASGQAAAPRANPFTNREFSTGKGGDDWDAASGLSQRPFSVGAGKEWETPSLLYPGDTGPGKVSKFNAAASGANRDFKVEEDALRDHLAVLDALYKQGDLSVAAYYSQKQAIEREAINAEIADLQRERAALAKDPKKKGAVDQIDAKITEKQNRLDALTAENDIGQQKALADLNQQKLDFEERYFKAFGQNAQARLVLLQKEIDKRGEALVKNGLMTQAEIDQAKAQAAAASEYETNQVRIAAIQDEEKQKEEDLRAAVANGTMTQTAADDALFALRQQLAAQLDALIQKNQELAQASGNPQSIKQANDQAAANNRLRDTLPSDQIALNKSLQSSFEGLFQSLTSRSMSAGDAFRKFGQSIYDSFMNIIDKRLGDRLFESLFGNGSGGSSGSGDSLMGWLGKLGAKLGLKGDGTGAAVGSAPGGDNIDAGGGWNPAGVIGGASSGSGLAGAAGFFSKAMTIASATISIATAATTTVASAINSTISAATVSVFGDSVAGTGGGGGGGGGGLFGGLFGGGGGLDSSGGSGGDGMASMSGGEGMGSLADMASFDVGTDWVPRDMVAKIHKGERIVPAAQNKPGFGGVTQNVTNNFLLQGAVDQRSQSQLATTASMSLQRAASRNG